MKTISKLLLISIISFSLFNCSEREQLNTEKKVIIVEEQPVKEREIEIITENKNNKINKTQKEIEVIDVLEEQIIIEEVKKSKQKIIKEIELIIEEKNKR